MIAVSALNVYPVKSCRGIALQRARVTPTGFEHDREFLIVRPNGQFVTQREEPRLALIETALNDEALVLRRPDGAQLHVPLASGGERMEVAIWRDRCAAFDVGSEAAEWLSGFLGQPFRLVRFDPRHERRSDPAWTGDTHAWSKFADAFAFLVLSEASLADLNSRLPTSLPMNRFRPNIVLSGIEAYGEDRLVDFALGNVALRGVKPCTRCAITTTEQSRGERDGQEPLRTLREYRFSRELKGVLFGQNAIYVAGAGEEVYVGQEVRLPS